MSMTWSSMSVSDTYRYVLCVSLCVCVSDMPPPPPVCVSGMLACVLVWIWDRVCCVPVSVQWWLMLVCAARAVDRWTGQVRRSAGCTRWSLSAVSSSVASRPCWDAPCAAERKHWEWTGRERRHRQQVTSHTAAPESTSLGWRVA